ncbi:hypothetical protein cypCar_00000115 [Cyprinus carpio]|nr:hypothetical protein cypCar_00000115 [Cyprinus carpio]
MYSVFYQDHGVTTPNNKMLSAVFTVFWGSISDIFKPFRWVCLLRTDDAGAKLDDFADFTTFGIATSLILRTPSLLDNILCMLYVLSVYTRLCFFSSGIPFMYRGLPCIYSSAILVCVSLLTGGNTAVLRILAVAMILFMVSQNFYPHDRVLESQAWKKVVYIGGVAMVFCSSFPPACVYYLLWSISYILFPTTLWSSKV